MTGFTKLFASIVHSTIWREEPHVKIVWVTMLALADRYGHVMVSVPGLADASRVTMEQCLSALERLKSPDEWSRTKEHQGRRIEEIDGGWALLNYTKYREKQDKDERRIAVADAVARHRAKSKQGNVINGNHGKAQAEGEADAKAEADPEREGEAPPPPSDGLVDFLKDFGCKTDHKGEDMMDQWRLYTRGLKPKQVRRILEEAKPPIEWPSEFKAARKALGV